MARNGLNCTFSYVRDGTRRAFRVRADMITHGTLVVADESQGRVNRAMYPHRITPAQFAIKVQCNGYKEKTALMNWMASYAEYILTPNRAGRTFPSMSVLIPSRKFNRQGVLVTGIEYGDHVGSMLWEPTFIFETSSEPDDKQIKAITRVVDPDNSVAFRENRYHYPTGVQLSGSQKPADGTFQPIIDASARADLTYDPFTGQIVKEEGDY